MDTSVELLTSVFTYRWVACVVAPIIDRARRTSKKRLFFRRRLARPTFRIGMLLSKLRRPINVVLVHPDIPGNTGCIGRTVMAVGGRLHLVHPLGFDLSERALKRAGLDYWPNLALTEHADWSEFAASVDEAEEDAACWLFTTKAADRPHWMGRYKAGDYLIFGSETCGAPQAVHDWVCSRRTGCKDNRVALPQVAGRSINLAAAVSAGTYEALRQCVLEA